MCRSACDNGWTYLTTGDSAGLRTEYNGATNYIDRRWSTGGAYLPGITSFFVDSPMITPHYASFPPRIDCSEVASSPTNQCAVVSLYQAGSTHLLITTLNGWTSSTGWTTVADRYDAALASRHPPDITLTSGGSNAYVVRTNSTSITNNVQVRRVELSSGDTTTVSLGCATRLPPRIAILPGDAALVVGARWNQPTIWQAHRVSYNWRTNVLSAVALDFGPLDNDTAGNQEHENNMIVSDFDVDCYLGDCVLAAVLHDTDDQDDDGYNVVQRRRFSVSGSTITVPDPEWTRDAAAVRANAVIGAARGSAGLLVSFGRAATSSGDTNNTRVYEYASDTATATSGQLLHRSDGGSCTNHVTPLGTIPNATQHGGTSIAICPSCNGGAGTLESVHLWPGPNNVCF